MRILHFIPALGAGGAERQLYLLCRETNTAVEHLVTTVSGEGRWALPLRELGVPVNCLGSRLRDPRVILRLRSEVTRIAPDLIHCWLPSMNIAGALAAGSTPLIASVRNVDDWKPWFYRLADRAVAPLWSRVIANSHAGAAEVVRTTGLAPHSIQVIVNGIALRAPRVKPDGAQGVVLTACCWSRRSESIGFLPQRASCLNSSSGSPATDPNGARSRAPPLRMWNFWGRWRTSATSMMRRAYSCSPPIAKGHLMLCSKRCRPGACR